MTVTKYLHSCLLVEEQGITLLIDPGEYTLSEKALLLSTLTRLDYLLITHEHADHFQIDFVKDIVKKFLGVKILTTEAIQTELAKHTIQAFTSGDAFVGIENSAHEKLFAGDPPQNVSFSIANRLIHPGDSLQFQQTADILALPITAPWGSVTMAVEKALSMKPKYIIPIHDWHWKDDVRKQMYERLTEYFKGQGIQFYGVETGQAVVV